MESYLVVANFKKVLVLPFPLSTEVVCAVASNAAAQKQLRSKGNLRNIGLMELGTQYDFIYRVT